MRCPTVAIDLFGVKTVINTTDFDSETMHEWHKPESENDIELNVPLPVLKPGPGRPRKNKT